MLSINASYLKARDEAYRARQQEPSDPAQSASTVAPSSVRWKPVPEDIEDPETLFRYLSPEVRQFAIAMEAQLAETDVTSAAPHRAPKQGLGVVDGVPRLLDYERPVRIYRQLLCDASRLMEAISHPNVTDRFQRPLAEDHTDRNPRRVAHVFWEAVSIACHCVRIADICGAIKIRD